jgi:hypothetical protein
MIEYVAIVIMFCIAGGIAFIIIDMPRPLTRAKDIGRLNKEFRRRTKVMGNRDWGDCLLSNPGLYILTMELHWKTNPSGKVRKNLPFFKEFVCGFFYKKSLQKNLTYPLFSVII